MVHTGREPGTPDTRAPQRLDRWIRGEPLDHRKLNQANDAINRAFGVDAPRQTGGPRPVAAEFGIRGPSGIEPLQFKSVKDDYIIAVIKKVSRTTGVVTEQEFKVAKPYLLRKVPFDGLTRNGITFTYASNIERTADDGTNTETQVIVPSYVVDDFIFAANNVFTGVFLSFSGSTIGTGSKRTGPGQQPELITLLDINCDARFWAKKEGT